MTKKYIDDKETRDFLAAAERGELVPVKNFHEMKSHVMKAAKNTIGIRNKVTKNKNINFRISDEQLGKLKIVAENQGLPYQTYLGLVVHQITAGKFRVSARSTN